MEIIYIEGDAIAFKKFIDDNISVGQNTDSKKFYKLKRTLATFTKNIMIMNHQKILKHNLSQLKNIMR